MIRLLKELEKIIEKNKAENKVPGVDVTVKEFIIAFENVTQEKINTVMGKRREGDIGGSYANIQLAKRTIDWKPEYSIEDAIFDVLKYYEL